MDIIARDWKGLLVGQRRFDGYVNITQLSKAYYQATGVRRETYKWLNSKRTQDSIAYLSTVTLIGVKDLVSIKRGSFEGEQGTWVHPDLVKDFENWLNNPNNSKTEKTIQLALYCKLGGKMEVPCAGSKIDLLTEHQVIEIKNAKNCCNALGQILVYGSFYPLHQKRIHLFGVANYKLINAFEKQCKLQDVVTTWE